MRALRSGERGMVAVDFLMVTATVLLPLFVGIVDLGSMLHARASLQRIARESARAASVGIDPGPVAELGLRGAGLDPARALIRTVDGAERSIAVRIAYSLDEVTILPWGRVAPGLRRVEAAASFDRLSREERP